MKGCIICLTDEPQITCIPCLHKCLCAECATRIQSQKMNCPLCQSPIQEASEVDDAYLIITKEELNKFDERRNQYLKELAGSERMSTKSIIFWIKEDGLLYIEYKVNQRTIKEAVPYSNNWDEIKKEFRERLAGDVISYLDFATYYPEFYWLWWKHRQPSLNGLVEK